MKKGGASFNYIYCIDFTIQAELKGHCNSITFSKLLTAWELGTGVYSNLVWNEDVQYLSTLVTQKRVWRNPPLDPDPPFPLSFSFFLSSHEPCPAFVWIFPSHNPDPPFWRPWPPLSALTPPLFLCHPVFVCSSRLRDNTFPSFPWDTVHFHRWNFTD